MTKRQRIDQARETRLWVGQIIVPTITAMVTIVIGIPELRQAVVNKYYDLKRKG